MSASGTKRTSVFALRMSAIGGKADIDAHFATRVDRSANVASGPWAQAALQSL